MIPMSHKEIAYSLTDYSSYNFNEIVEERVLIDRCMTEELQMLEQLIDEYRRYFRMTQG